MQHSPLLEHQQAQGARVTETQAGAIVLAHTEVPTEYLAGKTSCSLVDASTSGAIRILGADAPAFLHRLLANHVLPLKPGEGNPNLLLSSKGKVQARFDLFREEEGFRLDTPPDEAAPLITTLDMYLFGEEVELQDLSADCAPLLLGGPRAQEIAEQVVGPLTHQVVTRDWQGFALRISPAECAGDSGLRLDAGPKGCLPLWQPCNQQARAPWAA